MAVLFKSKFLIWLLFFVVTWLVAQFGSSFPTPLTQNSSIEDVKAWAGEFGDPTSYRLYGEELLKGGRLNTWLASCFPPGMAAMNAVFIVFKLDQHWMFWSQMLSVLLWATALFAVFLSIRDSIPLRWALLALNGFWVLPSMRNWAFGIGTLYSESKTHPLFVGTMALLFVAFRARKLRNYAWAGALMAACIYLRVYFEKMAFFFVIAMLASTAIGVIQTKSDPRKNWKAFLLPSLTFFLVGQLLLAPWLIRNRRDPRVNAYSMAPAQMHVTFFHLWERPESLPKVLGDGGATACLTDSVLCDSLHRQYGKTIPDGVMKLNAVITFLKHPFTWFAYRLSNFNQFWIGVPFKFNGLKEFPLWLEGLVAYATTVACLWFGFLGLRKTWAPLRDYSWVALSFFAYNALVFTLAGMDTDGRHAVPIRVFAYFCLIWFVSFGREAKKTP